MVTLENGRTFLKFLFCTGLLSIKNVVIASGAQQSNSATHIPVSRKMEKFYKKEKFIPERQETSIKLQGYPCLGIINESRWHMAGVTTRKNRRSWLSHIKNTRVRILYVML